MTEWICRECTMRSGKYMTFELFSDGQEFHYDPRCCPFCTQSDYIEPFDEFDGVVR